MIESIPSSNCIWEPNQSDLRQILQLLQESQSPNTETQRKVQQVVKTDMKLLFFLGAMNVVKTLI